MWVQSCIKYRNNVFNRKLIIYFGHFRSTPSNHHFIRIIKMIVIIKIAWFLFNSIWMRWLWSLTGLPIGASNRLVLHSFANGGADLHLSEMVRNTDLMAFLRNSIARPRSLLCCGSFERQFIRKWSHKSLYLPMSSLNH